jgi:hypothetical protein
MGPRTVVDDVKKIKILPLPGLELQPLGYPDHSQSLYRLRYPGSHLLQARLLLARSVSKTTLCSYYHSYLYIYLQFIQRPCLQLGSYGYKWLDNSDSYVEEGVEGTGHVLT